MKTPDKLMALVMIGRPALDEAMADAALSIGARKAAHAASTELLRLQIELLTMDITETTNPRARNESP